MPDAGGDGMLIGLYVRMGSRVRGAGRRPLIGVRRTHTPLTLRGLGWWAVAETIRDRPASLRVRVKSVAFGLLAE
jgi:hypothetical protein